MPEAKLKNYNPPLRSRLAAFIARNFTGDDRRGYRIANRLTDASELSPVGALTAAHDAGRFAARNNLSMAALSAMGVGIPAFRGKGKAVKKGIKAFHGSPHDFDKFSMDKIGTGEGAQAFGHGLYFAENEGVARSYRDKLSTGVPSHKKVPYLNGEPILDGGHRVILQDLKPDLSNIDELIAKNRSQADGLRGGKMGGDEMSKIYDYNADYLEGIKASRPELKFDNAPQAGHMYEVNINADPESFLDWDKPLSEQSQAIQDKFAAYVDQRRKVGSPQEIEDLEDILRIKSMSISQTLRHISSNAEKADRLKRAGIPGIRYLDQGSRSEGKGSSNYVVFDERLIEIMKKFGISAAAATSVLSALDERPES